MTTPLVSRILSSRFTALRDPQRGPLPERLSSTARTLIVVPSNLEILPGGGICGQRDDPQRGISCQCRLATGAVVRTVIRSVRGKPWSWSSGSPRPRRHPNPRSKARETEPLSSFMLRNAPGRPWRAPILGPPFLPAIPRRLRARQSRPQPSDCRLLLVWPQYRITFHDSDVGREFCRTGAIRRTKSV